ncbi:flagellar basal body rod protein FlgC [Methylobacter sp. S3L5C]|uniref:flagellar basal body rod protein FlgC n=1 Tax=Methylobacter sp. S3L5C TaxID=2839024 RepID=UPI001FAB4655|nr:flagellar basal body rod protein FlgC [Methylobacter sp. S3L5C]UOA08762.1 flagellar basal body rod protein FlgC [Methylobacter sp. S3L5C]
MSLLNIFNIAGSAMSAQGQRLNVVASNLANADSTIGPNGLAYRAKQVEFMTVPVGGVKEAGVKVSRVIDDTSPAKLVYNPGHPQANKEGYVAMPNVNVAEEMVNMLSASRSYQTNVDTMNAAKSMLLKTLTIGQ